MKKKDHKVVDGHKNKMTKILQMKTTLNELVIKSSNIVLHEEKFWSDR